MKNNNLRKNLLICGDNIKALNDLKKQGIKVDLIYLDPPFFSNRYYEVVWGDEAEVRSFKDRWAGGINVYIGWMNERVIKMYDILKDTGSFYLHCDWHASHYLKIILDEIFGYHNFRNEIIWCYRRYTAASNRFQRLHDTILFYTKTKKAVFNQELIPYGERSGKKDSHYKLDEDGRWYRWQKRKNQEPYKVYLSKGVRLGDWWDIPFINASAKERLGYPTQKPERLLERIIKSSSNEGGLVLDPFCGCGTAMAVAHRLKRKWIGIDISPTAVSLIERRLEKIGAIKSKDFDVIGMPTTAKALKELEPFEFQNWVINEMGARQSKRLVANGGLDGYIERSLYHEGAGIQVKQSERVGRNVVDNFEAGLDRKGYKKGYIVAFSFTKGAHEEAARKKKDGLEIKLIKVEDLLRGKPGLLK